MRKLAGSVCLLAGCLLSALIRQREKRRRIRTLRDLCTALARMADELSGKNTALPILAAALAEASLGSVSLFFGMLSASCEKLGESSFRSIWRDCVMAALPELESREQEAFAQLGDSLGRYPLERQLSALSRCRETMEEEHAKARLSYCSDTRLVWGLSLSAGLLLWIVLM